MKIANLIKISFALLLTISISTKIFAQDSRNVSLKSFNAITVSSGIDLYLSQANNENLVIKGTNDLIKNVIVTQNGKEVTVKYKDGISWGRLFKNQSIKVYVNYKTLAALTASGGSDVYTQNTLNASELNLRASGGSDLKMTLAVKDLTLTISGGSDADLKGKGENLIATASGGSDLDAFDYMVNNAKIIVSGGSDANVYVNKALQAGASGGSDISYKGNAVLNKTSSSKSGEVRHVN